jgi:MFS family permease
MVKSVSHFFLLFALIVVGPAAAENRRVLDVYFFFSSNCPHCHDQLPLMQAIDAHNPDVAVHFHEISQSPDIWREFLDHWQIRFTGVPRTFIGELTFVGYADSGVAMSYSDAYQGYLGNRVQIIKAVEKALGHRLELGSFAEDELSEPPGLVRFWPLLLPLLCGLGYVLFVRRRGDRQQRRFWLAGLAAISLLSIFLFLALLPDAVVQSFAQQLPFPLFVCAIALADGFNPCAFTVLIILLSLLTYTRSRKEMLLLGGTFIATSAIMYFLFIMILVLLGGFFLDRYGSVIMLVLGGGITAAGLINIKDFFFFNKGISLSLSEEQKLRFTRKAATIVKGLGTSSGRLWLAAGGTVMLGVFVNLVELGCTAILPAVFSHGAPPRSWRCRSFASSSSNQTRVWRQQDRGRRSLPSAPAA